MPKVAKTRSDCTKFILWVNQPLSICNTTMLTSYHFPAADGSSSNKEATGNESLPPSGYIVAGKMRLGSISVPAPNSAHLRRDCKSQKLPPFRSESINSGSSSSFLPKELTVQLTEIENSTQSSVSERESISPHRLLPHEEVIKNSHVIMTDSDEQEKQAFIPKLILKNSKQKISLRLA